VSEPLSLSPKGAAEYLGVSVPTIYRLLSAKAFTAKRLGTRTLIDGKSLRTFYAGQPDYVPGNAIPNAPTTVHRGPPYRVPKHEGIVFDEDWVPLYGPKPVDPRLKQARALLGPDGSEPEGVDLGEDAQMALDLALALDVIAGGDEMYAGAEYAHMINRNLNDEPRDYLTRYYAVADLFRRAKRTMH
jgi:excisionase family DNA binding protein